jgi:hypothetical protein
MFEIMSMQEQQRVYSALCSRLQTIGQVHLNSLPAEAVSLAVALKDGKVILTVYDEGGKQISYTPTGSLKADLDAAFLDKSMPEMPVAMIRNTTKSTAQ